MEKNSLFYMANLYPEIGRLFDFYNSGKTEALQNAQKRSLDIVEKILSFRDVRPAGREEWCVIKNFLLGFAVLGEEEKTILKKYAEPFSYKFMSLYTAA